MAKSTRITISFPGNLWEDVSRNAHRLYFRSGAQLMTALATVAVDAINRAFDGENAPNGNLHDEIEAIFAELAAYEPQPEGIVPKKPRSTSLSMYECKDFYKRMGYIGDAEGDAEGVGVGDSLDDEQEGVGVACCDDQGDGIEDC